MDNQKATYPSKVRLSEFFFTIVAMASECIDKTCKFSSNDFKHRPKMLLPHSDNHSFIHILEIALALIYQAGLYLTRLMTLVK